MALYGKQLAKQVPDSTTGHQARAMFGAMATALADAYAQLYAYGKSGWSVELDALADAIEGDAVTAARGYLDSTNGMVSGYYAQMPATDDVLSADALVKLRASVSTCSVAVKTVDDLFATSFLSQLSDSIVEAAGTVSASVANVVSKVGGSFLGGTWWLWACGAVVLVVWSRFKRSAL